MNYAPIAIFVYNRPKHTRETLEALLKNPECSQSDLFVFSDAARDQNSQYSVEEVRNYIKKVTGFKSVKIIERERNFGLANSVIDGVTQLCDKYGKVIVLEDDLEASSQFLNFMNTMLDHYEDQDDVGAISGYMFPVKVDSSCFFREVPLSWGWATWKRAWSLMEIDGRILLKDLQTENKAKGFDKVGHMPMVKMLKDQINGKNSSWYVRWAATLYLSNKLTLMPSQSLIRNLGIDGTGTHCAYWRFNPYEVSIHNAGFNVVMPDGIVKNIAAEKKLFRYFIKLKIIRYVNFIYRIFSLGRYKLRMS